MFKLKVEEGKDHDREDYALVILFSNLGLSPEALSKHHFKKTSFLTNL